MTISRTEDIATRFNEWLDRYSPPRHMADNERALQAEVNALLHPILRFAPKSGWGQWLDGTLASLDAKMKTRAWPTVSEVTSACQGAARAAAEAGVKADFTLNPVRVVANRMQAGDAVGEEWLYGRRAVELERACLVGADRMQAYRSALFFSWKNAYGEPAALRMEAEAKARHARAEDLGPLRPPGVMADKPRADDIPVIPANRMHIPAPRYEPGSDVVEDAPEKPSHWTETVAPDSPEMQALRAARQSNPIMQAAMRARANAGGGDA